LAWEVIKASAAEVGDMLRKKVIDLRFTPKSEPTTSTAGWITDPNGSRFLVNAGWKWEEK
jgi:hypothetical protein